MQHNPVNEGVLLLVGPGSRYIVADYGLRSLRAGGELMPADRRIVVNVSAEGHRDERGDYVPGEVTPIAAWATRRDVGQERKVAFRSWVDRIPGNQAGVAGVCSQVVRQAVRNMSQVGQGQRVSPVVACYVAVSLLDTDDNLA